jgi:hypothetical protein
MDVFVYGGEISSNAPHDGRLQHTGCRLHKLAAPAQLIQKLARCPAEFSGEFVNS